MSNQIKRRHDVDHGPPRRVASPEMRHAVMAPRLPGSTIASKSSAARCANVDANEPSTPPQRTPTDQECLGQVAARLDMPLEKLPSPTAQLHVGCSLPSETRSCGGPMAIDAVQLAADLMELRGLA